MSKKVNVNEIPFERMVILPPKPGVCRICAVAHHPDQPHDRESLYYQIKFRQKYGRFPTWNDAMAHCDENVKNMWTDALAQRGIYVGLLTEDEENKRMD